MFARNLVTVDLEVLEVKNTGMIGLLVNIISFMDLEHVFCLASYLFLVCLLNLVKQSLPH